MASLDDDRWAKPVDAFANGCDMRMDMDLTGSSNVFQPGQGYNTGFARKYECHPFWRALCERTTSTSWTSEK